MSQQGKLFKQRYYWNLNNLRTSRPVLLSGNVQSEHVEAGEIVQTSVLSEHQRLTRLYANVTFR